MEDVATISGFGMREQAASKFGSKLAAKGIRVVVGEPTQVTPEGYDIYPVSATMDCTGGNCGADYIAGNVVEFFDQDSGPPEEYTTRCAGCKQVKS